MDTITIDTRDEYFYLKERGYEPLMEELKSIKTRVLIPNQLRRELQDELFPSIDKYYRFCYAMSNKVCEETKIHLPYYSAAFVSHILSRGANPAMAKDIRNHNILSLPSHNKWEVGDRKSMKIYQRNQIIIQRLQIEYYGNN